MTQTAVDYETVIGLEVHCQILTQSKMFCGCSSDESGAPENTHLCPICLGMPGTMPVANRLAVENTVMTGLALNCEIPEHAKFDRKNYHYPDLMKGYQISQYDLPFCVNGWLEVEVDGEPKRVGITRVHLEEDTARMRHEDESFGDGYSLVDINRSGVPLMEIVSEPDMRSPEEAREYLVKLRGILRAIGVSKANMEEGNFRCDANVSLRRRGASAFGTKVEIKNMNSFRSVERALKFEVERQAAALDSGQTIGQETRGWLDTEGRTVSQRSKEFAHDYRYFPEPDLPPFTLTRAWVESLRARLPELPEARKHRLMEQYGLNAYDAGLLAETAPRAAYFERAAGATDDPAKRAKAVANWMLGEMARFQNADGKDIEDVAITPAALAALVTMVESGTLTSTAAKSVFEQMYRTGAAPEQVAAGLGLSQTGDDSELESIVDRVIASNPKPVADYRGGKSTAIQALIGRVMGETKGRYAADRVRALLQSKLESA
ncbi:MAG: Asp-tRNA(Asn)/Glu-tRNA(Gln) amidotransferase subunit GatB [Dehalococcoidia bacterium]